MARFLLSAGVGLFSVESTIDVLLVGRIHVTTGTMLVMTVSTALELIVEPAKFETTTEYTPASLELTLKSVRVELMASGIVMPSLRQAYPSGRTPLAVTLKFTSEPLVTVWLGGCVTIAGEVLVLSHAPRSAVPSRTLGFPSRSVAPAAIQGSFIPASMHGEVGTKR